MYTETQKINALEMGMEVYSSAAKNVETMPAAYGLAVSLVGLLLNLSVAEACLLVSAELRSRGR